MAVLSYRGDAFGRAKRKNRERVEALGASGHLNVMLQSKVKEFTQHDVSIALGDDIRKIRNDAAIICAGGILPTGFLKDVGIAVETKHGTA